MQKQSIKEFLKVTGTLIDAFQLYPAHTVLVVIVCYSLHPPAFSVTAPMVF